MPYTVPVTFVNGDPLLADDLNANNDALRKYINRDIIPADFGTDVFGTTEIVKGEYANVVQDHQFQTGDMYTQNVVSDDNGGNRQYFTSTIKTQLGDGVTHSGQWTQVGQYQIVAETGKSIYFEGNNGETINNNLAAKIIITGHIGVRNYQQYVYNQQAFVIGSKYGYIPNSPQETRFYLLYKVEGVADSWQPVVDTKGSVLGFEEYQSVTGGTPATSPPTSGTTLDRRVIPFLFELDVQNLWATSILPNPKPQTLAWRFAIGVESSIDLGWVNNRTLTYEVFYC